MIEQETFERTPDVATEQPRPALPDEAYYQRAPQRNSGAARVGALLVIAGLLWLAIELVGYGPFFGGSRSSTSIAAPLPGNRIELDLGVGDVDIQTAAGSDVRVDVTKYGIWQGDPLAVSQLGDRALVRNEARSGLFWLCFGRCGLSYHITAPANVNMLVHTSSGDISIAGVTGEVALTSSSGDVTARDIAHGLAVTTSSGESTLSRVGGRIEVQTSSGDVRLDQGQVVDANIQTSSGDIDLSGVSGALTLGSSSGDVTVRDAHDGRLNIQTESGEVNYTGNLAGDSSITTSSGDVTLHLPAGSAFVLDASTSSGDMESEFDLRERQQSDRSLSGVAGAGGAALKIATSSGDIDIGRQ
jgi:DUF4097 and DUF4098 domain-containing protein YvlB